MTNKRSGWIAGVLVIAIVCVLIEAERRYQEGRREREKRGREFKDGSREQSSPRRQEAHTAAHAPEWEAAAQRRADSLAKAADQDAAVLLKASMGGISEEYYCAGWLIGLEHKLWRMVEGGDRRFGMGEVREDEATELKRLSEKAGGWWIYSEDNSGETFVTAEEWQAMLKAKTV